MNFQVIARQHGLELLIGRILLAVNVLLQTEWYDVRPSVRPSVHLSDSPAAAACGGFAAVGPEISIDCYAQQHDARQICGQCRVFSWRRKLNRDLFLPRDIMLVRYVR